MINMASRLGSAVLVLCCVVVRLHAGESPRQRLCGDAFAIITDEGEDPRLKTKLVELLALLPAADSAGTLGKLLHSKGVDQQTVMYALSTLTRHGTDGALDQLMAALGNAETSPETKQQIVTSCYRRGLARRKDIPVLQAVVKEGPAGALLPAAILLGRLGAAGEEVVDALLGACGEPPEGIALRDVLEALGRLRTRRALPALVKALGSRDRMAAQAAWFGLMKTTLQDLPFESGPWEAWWAEKREAFQVREVTPELLPSLVESIDASRNHQYRDQVEPLIADAGEEGLKLLTERALKKKLSQVVMQRLQEDGAEVWSLAFPQILEDKEVKATNAFRLIRELRPIPEADLQKLLLGEKTADTLREVAALKLANTDTPEAVAVLDAALEAEDERVRRAVLRGIVHTPSARFTALYLKGLSYGSTFEISVCESALGRLGPRVAPSLLACLTGPAAEKLNASARCLLVKLLARARYAPATDALIAALKDKSPTVRAEAAEALDDLQVPLARLLPVPDDANSAIRAAVANALYRTKEPPIGLLRQLAGDRDAGVRERVMQVVARSGKSECAPLVLEAFKDTSPKVRIAAVNAVESLGLKDAKEALLDLAASSHTEASYAIQALARLCGSEVLPFILEQAKLDEEPQRSAGLTALGRINDPKSVEYLMNVLQNSPSAAVRVRAVASLSNLKAKPAADLLLQAFLHDADRRVRTASRVALTQITNTHFAPDLKEPAAREKLEEWKKKSREKDGK